MPGPGEVGHATLGPAGCRIVSASRLVALVIRVVTFVFMFILLPHQSLP
jgi:hypothetical protein